jgi:GAF domain-containing protein
MAAKLFNAPMASIALIDEHRQWFKARVGIAAPQTPREVSFCAHAIQSDDVLVVADASRDPRFHENPLVTGDPAIRFYAGAPLVTSDGCALGTVCVIDIKARVPLSTEEEEALRDLARMAMMHIQTRQALGYIDPVTGCSNRLRLLEDIDAALSAPEDDRQSLFVIAIDAAAPQGHRTRESG